VAERIAVGVDIGGTKVEVAVTRRRDDGALDELARRRFPTSREGGYDAVLVSSVAAIQRTAGEAGVDLGAVPVGIGMPGGITRRGGLVKNSNTVCMNGRPFRQDLSAALGIRPVFDNDANCFALAEAWLGAAAPFREGVVFGVIMGTGVGGGLVLGGRPWAGGQGIAGEWGHHAVWAGAADARACYCGQRGCLERYIAGPALEEAYLARSGARRTVTEMAGRRGQDADAAAVIEGLLETFGRALANVIDIVDPAVVVLGGGLSNLDLLYDEGRARVERCVFNDELCTPIVRHALGDSAGVLGAALLAFDAQCPGALA
jgi:fructokinase